MALNRTSQLERMAEGLTIAELAVIFKLSPTKVKSKLASVEPSLTRMGNEYYEIRKVAGYLMEFPIDTIKNIMDKMGPENLSPELTRVYWSAQRERQEYQLRNGDLWETSMVQQKITRLFMIIRNHVRMMSDAVERRTELSQLERDMIKDSCDGLLRDLQMTILEEFSHKNHELTEEFL